MEKSSIVIDYITKKIKDGIWTVGHRIDSETKLAKELGLSRNTVREALSMLLEKRIIVKKTGSGSFIYDISSIKNKKYVLIFMSDFYLSAYISYPYKLVLEKITSLLQNKGYEPVLYIYNEAYKPVVNVDISELAGIISFFGADKKEQVFLDSGIPIVSVMGCTGGYYPNVIFNYTKLYRQYKELIEENKWENVLFFFLERDIFKAEDSDVFVHVANEKYFESKYDCVYLPYFSETENLLKKFREKMKSIDKIPEAILFSDDVLFSMCEKLFFEFDDVFSKTNLITFSSGEIDMYGKYNICTLGFDLDEIVNNAVEMLENYINGRYSFEIMRQIEPKVFNKENLKNHEEMAFLRMEN